MRHGFWVALFVLLALTFQKTTRVASICVLAAQIIVDRGAPLLTPLLGRSAATGIADKGSNSHLAAVTAVAGMGLLVQFLLYVRPPNAWALPNGSAMPVLFRAVAAAPQWPTPGANAGYARQRCVCKGRRCLRPRAGRTDRSNG